MPPNTYPLLPLCRTPMSTPISSVPLTAALSAPPFIPIASSINIRDIGLLPSSRIPVALIYRSGTLPPTPSLSSSSTPSISSLNPSLILDLRSAREILASPDPIIPGAQNVAIEPVRRPAPVELSAFAKNGGKRAYAAMYMDILDVYCRSWRVGLEWVLNWREGGGGMVVHCSAGKDRTGVFTALLLSLAGAERQVIAYDYELTRIGIEPRREELTRMLVAWNEEWTMESPGMSEFTQVKGEFILGFLDAVEEKYGGVEAYTRDELGFSAEDVGKIKRVLTGERVES